MSEHPEESLLSAYLDGQVTSTELETVVQHLRDCTRCRLQVEEFRETKNWLAQAPRKSAPLDLIVSLEQQLKSLPLRRPAPPRRSWLMPSLAAASLLVAVTFFRHRPTPLPFEPLLAAHERSRIENPPVARVIRAANMSHRLAQE